MSVLVETIDGDEHVILPHPPDWSVKPQRALRWRDGVGRAATGRESRQSSIDESLHALAWELLPFDFKEQRMLEQRVLAATKSGLAVAPYWGRGLKLLEDTAGDRVVIAPTRWPFYDGQLLFFQQPGPERWDEWELATVIGVVADALAGETEVALDEPLASSYPAGTFCWPILWGRFEAEELTALHLGRGTLQVRITQRTPFPTAPVVACIGIYDFFDYDLGEVSNPALLVGGCGLTFTTSIQPNLVASVAHDFFESYSVGPVTGADLVRGVGWAGAADVATNYARSASLDTFETYTVGTVTGADLTAGTGWTAAASIETNA